MISSIVVIINLSFSNSSLTEENFISFNFAKFIIRFLFSSIIFFFSRSIFLRKIIGLDFDGIFFSTLMDLNVETSLINKSIQFSNDLLLLIFCGHEEEIANCED